jgi:hypothetical protein
MDNEEEDVIINVEAEEEPEQVAIPPEDGIAELRRQLEAERAARQNAERAAYDARRDAHHARNSEDETNVQLVSNAIDTLRRDDEILKQNYQYAMSQGNFSAAADIQQEMSGNAAKLLQLSNGLEAMKSRPKQPEPVQTSSDPVEAFAAQLSSKSADWVRRHPEYVKDAKLNRKMIAAHELAMADGIRVDSEDYFTAIEETLKIKPSAPQTETSDEYAAKVTQRRDAAPAAAPVSRGGSTRTNVVRLSAAEREMADMMGMKPEDYAKNKMALQKEGKLN